ncbi:hypothetical protein [Alienimonas sp. DA493]|uniref:hypothetical protein n=1 Tax=Alienimonas sp. DA493 TaxID=3373605 RepID=UPI0037545003
MNATRTATDAELIAERAEQVRRAVDYGRRIGLNEPEEAVRLYGHVATVWRTEAVYHLKNGDRENAKIAAQFWALELADIRTAREHAAA